MVAEFVRDRAYAGATATSGHSHTYANSYSW